MGKRAGRVGEQVGRRVDGRGAGGLESGWEGEGMGRAKWCGAENSYYIKLLH